MKRLVLILFVSALLIGAQTAPKAASAQSSSTAGTLQIAVLEGEDAVNIVQQKTAVAPVVEVRDRNSQPVAGAVVRFAIRNGRATFSGARTLTVTTNAAGRAVAAGLTPTGSGALQISASAAFQGQTAAAVIAQTNVMTVAQAAALSGAAGSGGGVAGGAGGAGSGGAAGGSGGAAGGAGGAAGGGGLSATTIGIVGGAAAGGAIAAKEVLGGHSSTIYSGPYSGTFNESFTATCIVTVAHSGTVSVDVDVAADGTVTGTGSVQGTMTNTAENAGCGSAVPLNIAQSHGCGCPDPTVNGTSGNINFSGSHPGLLGTNWTYAFFGALSGTTIAGTFTLTTVNGNLTTVRPFSVSLSKEP